jgi:hypothetical protein
MARLLGSFDARPEINLEDKNHPLLIPSFFSKNLLNTYHPQFNLALS